MLAMSASSISLNKAITTNSAFNNIAAALNLNLMQKQNSLPQTTNISNKSFSPIVAAVAVAQLQSFHNSKKLSSIPLQAATNNNSGNFSFLNSFNASSNKTSEWQLNQAFASIESTGTNAIENILSNSGITVNKNFEFWNKLRNNQELNQVLTGSLEQLEKQQRDESKQSGDQTNLQQNLINLPKNEQLKNKNDVKDQLQDNSKAPNMTMINVENLNFYTSIEGANQQPQHLSHEFSCSNCLKNLNNNNFCNQFQNCNSTSNQATSSTDTYPAVSPHISCPQASAAAMAINIANLLTNNSKHVIQNDDCQMKGQDASMSKHPKKQRINKSMENGSHFEIKTEENGQNKNKSNPDQLGSSIKIESIKNVDPKIKKNEFEKLDESLASTSSLSDESKTDMKINYQSEISNRNKLKQTNKNSIIIQKDPSSSLLCSCRIKLEPECMTITIDTNKDNSQNCCSMKNFQQIDLKLSPGKLNISKKTIFNQKEVNEDVDYDSDSNCSSSSGSIHLIVDEASTILEQDGQLSNISKEKTIDSNEIKNLKSELTDKETLSDSNFNTTDNFATDSKDNNSSSTRFFFSNKNSSEVNLEADNIILKNDQKMNKKWSLSKAEFNEQVIFFH